MNLTIVVDTTFVGLYHLKNDKRTIATLFKEGNEVQIGFTSVRLSLEELREVYDFVTDEKNRLTDPE